MPTYILRILLLCGLCFLGVSCTTTGSTTWQTTVDGVAMLHKNLEFPRYLAKADAQKEGGEFDVNRYFGVLIHLSMQPGYVLDYIYHYDGMGGYPVLYARPSGQAPYTTESEFTQAIKESGIEKANEQYYPYLQVDDTAAGYFEYVVFKVMAEQFYLYWHAGYNDIQIIPDSAALDAVLKQKRTGYAIPITTSLQARMLRLESITKLEAETATVQIVTFSAWKGFAQETWTISRRVPHTVLSVDSKVLVPYNCGIMF